MNRFDKEQLMATIRNGTTALVVIDVQTDVMQEAWDRDGVIGRISTLIDRARGENVPVIYVQHHDDYMEQESIGWQFVEEIAPRPGDVVIAKQYPDSFEETDLEQTLAGLGISHLVIAGAQTDACIRTTTHRALAEGYDMTLVEDCHTTDDREFGGVTITAKQLVFHTNLCMWAISYPGRVSGIAPHDAVSFTMPDGAQSEEEYANAAP
jgi:nicotinamidase-related amidase